MLWREVAMKGIKKILAPTDLSEDSLAGVGYALTLARTLGAELTVLHVVNYDELWRYGESLQKRIIGDPAFRVPDPYLKEYETALQNFLAAHFFDVLHTLNVHTVVEVGDPDEAIIRKAQKDGADLIVLAARKRTGFARFLKRDIAEAVRRNASCPVLTIGMGDIGDELRAA
jgi:nucleotide-binding universal stress UspA family protein